MELPENHTPRNLTASRLIIRNPVLFPAQEDISMTHTSHPGQKSPPWRTECQIDIVFRAFAHESGRGPRVREGDNILEGMQRITGYNSLFSICHYIFSIQCEINVFGGHKKCVQQMSHLLSSIAADR